MPDGSEIESIVPDHCLCVSSQVEILSWIVQQIPEIMIDENIEIEHSPFGYNVRIVKTKWKYAGVFTDDEIKLVHSLLDAPLQSDEENLRILAENIYKKLILL